MQRLLSLCVLIALCSPALSQDTIDADILLKGGTLYDGTGGAEVTGDVAIKGGKIIAVGTFKVGQALQTIDCTGLAVAPGFIDLHNHSDSQMVDPRTRANVNFLMQGCTTVVTGNCGSGPVNAATYFKKIDEAGAGTNVIHLLPQGSLREQVIGSANRPPTAEELQKMRDLAEQAMKDGVYGMSTGLIYVPSSYASTDEIVEIASVVGKHGGIYASHIRGEGLDLLKSVNEAIEIGRRGQLAVHVSHFKASGPEAWGLIRQAAVVIEKARQSGQVVTADQYPYIASSTSLEAMLIPTWARAGGGKDLIKRLDDAEDGSRIRHSIANELEKRGDQAPIRIARYKPRPDWVGKSITEIAQMEKRDATEIVLEITRAGGASGVSFGMAEDDVRFAMQIPWVATASDGRAYLPGDDRPHPRSYGTFPRKIGYYADAEKVVTLSFAIRSSSGLPADILGLSDRGYLKADQAADIAIFDPQTFRDAATFDNPHRYATGTKYVFVNGQPTVWEGTPTGALPGKALKHKG